MVTLAGQFYAFLLTIVAGASVGIIFDFYRVLRASRNPKRWLGIVYDVLYWVVVTPTVIILLLIGNWGDLRYYVLLGMALGLFVYFQIFSSFVLWSLVSVQQSIGALSSGISRAAMSIVTLPARLVGGSRWSRPGGRFLTGVSARSRWSRSGARWRGFGAGRAFRWRS